MLPTYQRLDACQPSIDECEGRLVEHHKLLVIDSLRKLGFELDAFNDGVLHDLIENQEPASSTPFRFVHGDICGTQHLLTAARRATQRSPATGTNHEFSPTDHTGPRLDKGIEDPSDNTMNGSWSDLSQQHREFVTAHPCNSVTLAHHRTQALCELCQQLITDAVPMGVVDILEIVQVQIDDRIAATLTGERTVEQFNETSTAQQAGQTIEMSFA